MPHLPGVFTESSLAAKEILLNSCPKVRHASWSTRLRNTTESLLVFVQAWTSERLLRKDGSQRKRTAREAVTLCQCAALLTWVVNQLRSDPCVKPEGVNELIARFVQGPRENQKRHGSVTCGIGH